MTDSNQAPEPTPAETPTAPLPTAPETSPVGATAPLPDTTPVPTAEQPPAGTPPHPTAHTHHGATDGAIAAMVIGALLLAMLSFGLGWMARGAMVRLQFQQAVTMMHHGYGQGFGQGYGGMQGGPGYGHGRRMMRGYGFGSGQNQGEVPGYGHGGFVPPGSSGVATTAPTN